MMEQIYNRNLNLYILSRLLCSPLEAIYTLLIFILSINLNAIPLQLTILACSKPIVSLFAYQITTYIIGKTEYIRNYLLLLNLLGCIPCFYFPFVDSVGFYLFAYSIFAITMRASVPAWIEILKNASNVEDISKAISKGSSLNYFCAICVPVACSYWLDIDKNIWRVLFCLLAAIQLFNTVTICLLKIIPSKKKAELSSLHISLTAPWINGWKLLKRKPDFAKYQAMFFLGGAGIIAIQPILPIFFKDALHLSYKQLALSFSFCKGLAFISTSSFWTNWVNRISIYRLNFYMNVFTFLFIICVLASIKSLLWLFVAYLMYGIMQAGTALSWNLSGIVFSKEEESTLYSNLNLAVVGLRGCFCPGISHLIFSYSNYLTIFAGATCLSLISIYYAWKLDKSYKFHS